MSATVPVTNSMVAEGQQMMSLGSPGEAPPVSIPLGGTDHSSNLHVGLILLAAGGVIAAFHLGGFRLAFDVGMGRG
jgi:hypothetical protein